LRNGSETCLALKVQEIEKVNARDSGKLWGKCLGKNVLKRNRLRSGMGGNVHSYQSKYLGETAAAQSLLGEGTRARKRSNQRVTRTLCQDRGQGREACEKSTSKGARRGGTGISPIKERIHSKKN